MIRYAVVGAGWISQEAFMPAVALTGNSRMQAIVSGSPDAARKLAAFHDVPEVVGYDGYDSLLASDRIDAVYIALPNDLHADYTIRALKAGKHVMVEKPLATTLADGSAMVAAAQDSGCFLMTAYRLHNEPGTHAMIEAVRSGKIGEPVYFGATFGFQTQLGNHRLKADHWGGALPDVGVYCLNAARHVFAAEPVAVQAMASRPSGDPRFTQIDASLAVTLKFPGELILDPAFKFDSSPKMTIRSDGKEDTTPFDQVDHFAGQIAYFSDCIAAKSPPEADGEEGLADMRALLAIDEAARTGETVRLDPWTFKAGIQPQMLRAFEPTTKRLLL